MKINKRCKVPSFSATRNNSKMMLALYLAASLVISILWALQLPYEWGSDFGAYYAGAMYTDDSYRLYSEFFDHKGPMYYAFLKAIGWIIGFGAPQALFSLTFTALIYFLSLVILIARKKKILATTVLLIAALSLVGQPTNASIALFLASQILFAYHFSQKYLATGKLADAALAGTFATSAALTRVDAVAYLLWVAGVLVIGSKVMRKPDGSALRIIKPVVVAITAGGALFSLIISIMSFSLGEMYVANISFNHYYKDVIGGSYFYRSNHFEILLRSGAIFVTGYLVLEIFKRFRDSVACIKSSSKLNSNLALSCLDNWATLTFALTGVAIWIYSGSDKDYHVYLILLPLLVLVINYGTELLNGRVLLVVVFLGLPFSKDVAQVIWRLVRYPDCLINPFCTKSPSIAYKDAVQLMIADKVQVIVGGRGWPYVFAHRKPIMSVNDWWLYSNYTPFITPRLQEQFDEIVNMKEGTEILIDKSLYNSDTGSPYLEKIRESYSEKNDLGYYLVLRKR